MKALILAATAMFSVPAFAHTHHVPEKHLYFRHSDIVPLARVMYLEDRQHGRRGMMAVADLIFNRVKSPLPDFREVHTITGAIFQKGQFSGYKPKYIRKINMHSKEWIAAKRDGIRFYNMYVNGVDITRHAVYYTRYDCHPKWRLHMLTTAHIGSHVMMRPRIRL